MATSSRPKATCVFDRAWIGPCGKDTGAVRRKFCPEHLGVRCVCCGEQAVRECDMAGSLVCGAPHCRKCDHKCASIGGWK